MTTICKHGKTVSEIEYCFDCENCTDEYVRDQKAELRALISEWEASVGPDDPYTLDALMDFVEEKITRRNQPTVVVATTVVDYESVEMTKRDWDYIASRVG